MSLSLKYGDPPLFCTLCGSELIPKEDKIGSQFIWIYMRCPKKKTPSWWNLWKEDKHGNYLITYKHNIMKFDPYTGKKLNRP